MECSMSSYVVATNYMWPLTGEVKVQLYFILLNLNLNSHTWLTAAMLDTTTLERPGEQC